MTDQIIRLRASDFDEAIDVMNRSFREHEPHDFEKLLPSMYQRTDERMCHNHAIRRDGRIVALLGIFPIEWCVGDARLRMAGIGGVATDPNSRGQGFMKQLMTHAVEFIRQEGYDLSYLGGQRQRYAYFGWESGGVAWDFHVIPKNIQHALGVEAAAGITFAPMSGDSEALRAAKLIHDSQVLHCDRPADLFEHVLHDWNMHPHAARDAAGTVVGYVVVAEQSGQWNELVAQDTDTALAMIHSWVRQKQSAARVQVPALPDPLAQRVGQFAERALVCHTGNWQIFNWPATLDALLRVRHGAQPLAPGSVVLRIAGRTMRLEVADRGARCSVCEDAPDLETDAHTAVRALFGPTSPSGVLELPRQAVILNAWCPLPLSIPFQDHV